MEIGLAIGQQDDLHGSFLPLGENRPVDLWLAPVRRGVLHFQRSAPLDLDPVVIGWRRQPGSPIRSWRWDNPPPAGGWVRRSGFRRTLDVGGVAAVTEHKARTQRNAQPGAKLTRSKINFILWRLFSGSRALPETRFSSRSRRLSNSGRRWKMATARSQMRLSKPGRAGDHLARRHIVRYRRLRREDDAVAQAAMPGDTGLAGQNRVVPDHRGAGQAHLRAQQRVLADARSMAHLHQVIDFGSIADFGGAHGRPVDAGVGLDIHPAAQPYRAGLRNLLPVAGVIFGKSKSVGADNRPVFERDVVPQDAGFPHHGMGMGEEVAAGLHARIEHHMGQQRGMGPQRARCGPTTTYAPMWAPSPISALGSMTAVG